MLFPTISFFSAACLVLIVSYDYRTVRKEIVQLFSHTSEHSQGKLEFVLRQAAELKNALISFHLSSVCFILAVPAASSNFFGLDPVLLVTLLCVVGFGCMVYGTVSLLKRLGHE